MSLWDLIEEFVYWGLQLQPHQEALYWACWCLIPSFVFSVLAVYSGKKKWESVWFISSLLNLILILILSLFVFNPWFLLLAGCIIQVGLLSLISHLIMHEK